METKNKEIQAKTKEEKVLLDVVSSETRFKKFSELLKAAKLDKKLSESTNFTLFAPVDEAFKNVPEERRANLMKPENHEQLRNQLLLYIVPGILEVDDLRKRQELNTEAGQTIPVNVAVNDKAIKLANANVMLPKEQAKNGCIYPLDALLHPAAKANVASAQK